MNQKQLTIAIQATTLAGWGGGIDLLTKMILSLLAVQDIHNIKLFILIPYEYTWDNKIKKMIKKTIDTYTHPNNLNTCFENTIKKKLDHILTTKDTTLSYIFFDHKDIASILKKINADVIFPIGPSSSLYIPKIPHIGYLFDFQHKYFPNLFSIHEYIAREKSFAELLLKTKTLLVNAHQVQYDIERFYPNFSCNIIALPFCPTIEHSYIFDTNSQNQITQLYSLPKNYFIISNQFWTHKNHITAIKALAMLPDKTIHLVLTGKTEDYRYPEFFEKEIKNGIEQLNLNKRVHVLGHIPKIDQITIMKNAIALIQPTLFEGGPGGGSASEALALGIPILASDIPVNKEINNERCLFFSAQSAEDLAQKMMIMLQKPYPKIDPLELEKKSHTQLRIFGKALFDAIEYASKQ